MNPISELDPEVVIDQLVERWGLEVVRQLVDVKLIASRPYLHEGEVSITNFNNVTW